jgi:hypothetical protein
MAANEAVNDDRGRRCQFISHLAIKSAFCRGDAHRSDCDTAGNTGSMRHRTGCRRVHSGRIPVLLAGTAVMTAATTGSMWHRTGCFLLVVTSGRLDTGVAEGQRGSGRAAAGERQRASTAGVVVWVRHQAAARARLTSWRK